ncbi:MAG: pirin family protein [Verrucomicrobia bacterium]|nr:pirin family protein [Verrucomicrobiota bacterium]
MITLRKAGERGHANHGWLDSWHTFSFADYFDPQHMQFRSLRVINDDTIAGGGGFDMHPHRDMEIVTYVLSGALQHRDSMGNTAVMRAGDAQQMSAGTGVTHSEFNASPAEPLHLLQIWILPERKGVKPGYADKSFAKAAPGKLHLVASKDGRDGSLTINQDADVWLAKFAGGETISHSLKPLRHAWIQVGEGEVELNGIALKPGDGAAVSEERELRLTARGTAQVLIFDLA